MSNPLSRIATRVAYGASQLPRVAWYVGHNIAMRRLAEEAKRRDGSAAQQTNNVKASLPDRSRLYADIADLLRQDLANVEAGLYPLPADHDGSLATLLNRSRLFFEDLPEVYRRRKNGGHSEVLSAQTRREAATLLSAEFPFPVGWLDDGGLGETLRHPG